MSETDAIPAMGAIPTRYLTEALASQLAETLDLATYLAVTHIVVAIAVVGFFWEVASHTYLVTLLLMVSTSILLLPLGVWISRYQPAWLPSVAFRTRSVGTVLLCLGIAWSTMPLTLFGPSDVDHRMLVVAIVAGLIATTFTLHGIPNLSARFCIPIVLGSFVALARTGEHVAAVLAVFLTIYAAFVLLSTRRMTRLATERNLDRVRVSDQKETIGLLLHEFEASTSDWLWETDAAGTLQHVSDRIAEVSGIPVDKLLHAPFEKLLRSDSSAGLLGEGSRELIALTQNRTPFRDHIVEIPGADGPRWWRLSGKPAYDGGGSFAGFRGVGADITATRRSEDQIAYLASYDSLTSLANRSLFGAQAAVECERAGRTNEPCALLCLDLDGFKIVNDTFGHHFGDRLLQQVARRLRAAVENGELVARLGGDEFTVLVPRLQEAQAVALAERLIATLSVPYAIDGIQVEIGASVGIAMTPRDAGEPQGLMGKADLALYRAKSNGKGRVSVFEPALERVLRARRELETDLKAAIAHDDLELNYQPLVSLTGGRVHAFEALLRWNTPLRGFVSPAEFVPVAEACGLISIIGRWVLHQACAEATRWPSDIRIAVNISPSHFRHSDLLQDVVDALAASGLDPNRLEIEITESIFFEMNAAIAANLRELRALGVRIALDDFGTGYSSLSYLIRFPVDKIKIDRSFIKDMSTRHECLAIIEAILTLAGKLSITVTAEGVESVEQARMLRDRKCGDIQGFLFSTARPKGEIQGLIETLPERFHQIFPADDRQEPSQPRRLSA
ncbi:putative bifunctional diguanylate cyclase/phosphodiesterase [uncultured Methylobacterium sp.]|uniref:putative bifunctional diguanylate cyclase/phosphodiesterase n=1 Tax=uncultured Methylobacterium sp. TaxID=157278 RepID=UPI0035CB628D